MRVLVPLLTGKEKERSFLDSVTASCDEVILLQVVDKEFFSRAGSAIGEVRQFRIINDEIKKFLKQKKKKCAELTEWGTTVSKIVSISLIHKVDKIFLVKQRTQFFEDVLKELKKNKIDVEVVEVQQEEPEKKKGFFG
jgi:hypothetical protein